ncbi:hypothetical protein JCM30760_00170 [Thiomicrorhabdus hydrogeniphila]
MVRMMDLPLFKRLYLLAFMLVSLVFLANNVVANDDFTRPGKINLNALETHNNGITLKVRPLKLMLGQPFTIYIEGEKLGKSSALLNWSHLKTAFMITDVEQHSSSLRITAYPLKVQNFTLKEQNAGLIHIPKTQITVAQNPEVNIAWQAPQKSLYSTQHALWKAQVTVNNPAFLVEIKPVADMDNPTVISSVLSSQNKSLPQMVSYEMPSVFNTQKIQLKSPVIEIKNTTNQRWKFFDYPQNINVKPLPIFLPMSVAVGQLNWHIMPIDKVYQTGNLYYWNWQLTGQGVSVDYMKSTANKLINQLTHNDQFTWLAESITVTQTTNKNGLVTKLNIQVPFRIKQAGLVKFPRLVLRSFNPQSAKVEQLVFEQVHSLALPSWLMWFFKWVVLMFVLMVAYLILLIAKQQWLNNNLRKTIASAQSGQAILQSMMHWQSQHIFEKKVGSEWLNQPSSSQLNTQSNHQVKIRSLLQFKTWHFYHYGFSKSLEILVNDLNSLLYSRHQQGVSFEQIQQNATSWAKSLSIMAVTRDVVKNTIKQTIVKLKRLRASKD